MYGCLVNRWDIGWKGKGEGEGEGEGVSNC